MRRKFTMEMVTAILEASEMELSLTQKVHEFLHFQIDQMPDYLRFAITSVSIVFNWIFIFIFFRPFNNLQLSRRVTILRYIQDRNVPIFSDFIRFFRSLILLAAIENSDPT